MPTLMPATHPQAGDAAGHSTNKSSYPRHIASPVAIETAQQVPVIVGQLS